MTGRVQDRTKWNKNARKAEIEVKARMCETLALPHQEYTAQERADGARDGQRVCHAVVLSFCAGVLAAAFVLRPHAEGVTLFGCAWPWRCWLHDLFGIRCALCGMSRSFCSLAHGDLQASLAFHPLGPALFTLFCLEVPYRIRALLTRPGPREIWLVRIHAGLVVLVCAAIFVRWLSYLGGLVP
jgi:hypothetical protein